MARTGIAAQVGYGQEETVGTAVTPTRFLPVLTESLGQQITRIESEADIPGRQIITSEQWNGGPKMVSGDIQHELPVAGAGVLLYNALGAKGSTSGPGPYTTVLTPGDVYGKALTVQVGRPDVAGTTHKFVYAGCKITDLELAMALDKPVQMGVSLIGMTETTGGSVTAASFGTGHTKPYKAITHGALSIAGSAFPVIGAKVKITRPFDERRFHGQATTLEPIQSDRLAITGEVTAEFEGLTAYNRFVNGTEAAFSYVLTQGDNVLTLAGNCRFDGATPVKSGRGVLQITMPVVFVSSGSADSDAFTVTVVNSDSTL